jgi:hypothetical protein
LRSQRLWVSSLWTSPRQWRSLENDVVRIYIVTSLIPCADVTISGFMTSIVNQNITECCTARGIGYDYRQLLVCHQITFP